MKSMNDASKSKATLAEMVVIKVIGCLLEYFLE